MDQNFTECKTLRWKLTAVLDLHRLRWFAARRSYSLDLCNEVQTLQNSAEHDMPTIKPWGLHSCDEELRAVGAGPSVGHAQKTGDGVLLFEVFVCKLATIDALTSSASAMREIAALEHKIWDDVVKDAALVMEWLARAANALFTSA